MRWERGRSPSILQYRWHVYITLLSIPFMSFPSITFFIRFFRGRIVIDKNPPFCKFSLFKHFKFCCIYIYICISWKKKSWETGAGEKTDVTYHWQMRWEAGFRQSKSSHHHSRPFVPRNPDYSLPHPTPTLFSLILFSHGKLILKKKRREREREGIVRVLMQWGGSVVTSEPVMFCRKWLKVKAFISMPTKIFIQITFF